MAFAERLASQVQRANSLICVGLDPDPTLSPAGSGAGRREAIVEFNRAIIEATADLVSSLQAQPRILRGPGNRWSRGADRDEDTDPGGHPGHPRLQVEGYGQHGGRLCNRLFQ